jgi:hypothetical protein
MQYELTFSQQVRLGFDMDPRPDLKDDSDTWSLVLAIAACYDKGVNAHGVWNALGTARVAGARLQRDGALRITQGDVAPEHWAEIREKYLLPNVDGVRNVLGFAIKSPRLR